MQTKTCCFFGHRKIEADEELVKKLYETVEKLIVEERVETFLFGSKSQFDYFCYKAVSKLKEKYPTIKRVYVRADYYITEDYEEFLLEKYEETYYPEKAANAGRAVYVERNYEMIDKSAFCIIYYKEDYALPLKKRWKGSPLTYQPKSGTRVAYEYAKRKKKTIINIVE